MCVFLNRIMRAFCLQMGGLRPPNQSAVLAVQACFKAVFETHHAIIVFANEGGLQPRPPRFFQP